MSLHCAITAHLTDDNKRKFSFATPLTIVSGICCMYNEPNFSNVPCSRCIVLDYEKTLSVFGVVCEHRGTMVPGLANSNEHKNVAAGRNMVGYGRARVKIH